MKLVRVSLLSLIVSLTFTDVAFAANYDVRFKLNSTGTYESLQFNVNYSTASGDFVGTGSAVTCTVNSTLNAMGAFNDVGSILTQGFIATSGVAGPVQVANCTFSASSAPSPSAFAVTITDWSSVGGSATPNVSVSSVVLIP